MPRADDPLLPMLENYSISRWTERENARERAGVKPRGGSADWLVGLIERKLTGER